MQTRQTCSPFTAIMGEVTYVEGPPKAPRPNFEKRYALKTEVVRAVRAVQATGISVVCIDLRPDGTIRLSSAQAPDKADQTEFDRWNMAGKL